MNLGVYQKLLNTACQDIKTVSVKLQNCTLVGENDCYLYCIHYNIR